MSDILLATLNAKYIHAAFGLRYLLANLGELKSRAEIAEFDINQKPIDIAEAILSRNPRILGLGVYIWNAAPTTELVALLKRIRPSLTIIVGGPEVSYEAEQQEIVRLADHVITGEADLMFAEVCHRLLGDADRETRPSLESFDETSPALPLNSQVRGLPTPPENPVAATPSSPEVGRGASPRSSSAPAVHGPRGSFRGNWRLPKLIASPVPDLAQVVLPYDRYDSRDVANRVIYVEASRGCPFSCEFCLSSLDIPVRAFPLEPFLAAMQRLLDRGVRQFKFVDRTFNLNLTTSRRILEFFLDRWAPGLFVHFEMIPDRLPEALRDVIARFPDGALQFEVGIQTFNPDVEQLISRRQDHFRLEDNLRWLRAHSGVHVHADLIAGLPGETLESFGAGFDRLLSLGPQEIQVGILKRLRGTPIVRHDREWRMIYSPQPPYEVLETRLLDFATLGRLRRFASFWDRFGNSGHFVESLPLLWTPVEAAPGDLPSRSIGSSAFAGFMAFADWLYADGARTSGIALTRQFDLLHSFLTIETGVDKDTAAATLARDYQRGGRSDRPPWMLLAPGFAEPRAKKMRASGPRRQARHRPTPAPR